jgi:hypothetical protein
VLESKNSCLLLTIWLAANVIVTIVVSVPLSRRNDGEGVVMTYKPPKRQKEGEPVALQEERLLRLLRQAERYAYLLAHSYDIGGQRDRAYGFVAFGERLREMATGVCVPARPDEPRSSTLRWQSASVSSLVPGLATEQPNLESQER